MTSAERLNELLALVHRDGGQYTILAGEKCSYEDARLKILDLQYQNQQLKDAIRRDRRRS